MCILVYAGNDAEELLIEHTSVLLRMWFEALMRSLFQSYCTWWSYSPGNVRHQSVMPLVNVCSLIDDSIVMGCLKPCWEHKEINFTFQEGPMNFYLDAGKTQQMWGSRVCQGGKVVVYGTDVHANWGPSVGFKKAVNDDSALTLHIGNSKFST